MGIVFKVEKDKTYGKATLIPIGHLCRCMDGGGICLRCEEIMVFLVTMRHERIHMCVSNYEDLGKLVVYDEEE